MNWYNILFLAGFFLLVMAALMSMAKEADRIHDKLEEFLERAKALRATEEMSDWRKLQELRNEVYQFAKKECWHRHFASHANTVLAYIDGRLGI